jgi:hypothetical protein
VGTVGAVGVGVGLGAVGVGVGLGAVGVGVGLGAVGVVGLLLVLLCTSPNLALSSAVLGCAFPALIASASSSAVLYPLDLAKFLCLSAYEFNCLFIFVVVHWSFLSEVLCLL